MRRRAAQFCAVVALLALTQACQSTSYRPLTEAAGEPLMGREVRYELRPLFHRDPPQCVTVLASSSGAHQKLGRDIAAAVARHLAGKVERVISPLQRRRAVRALAYDLDHAGDRRGFAIAKRCPFYAQARLLALADTFAVVWSEKRVGIAVRLFRASDDAVLWRAEHVARRGDGGIPLSPLSLVTSAATAGAFAADAETMPSLLDDALRRIMRTLPDTR